MEIWSIQRWMEKISAVPEDNRAIAFRKTLHIIKY